MLAFWSHLINNLNKLFVCYIFVARAGEADTNKQCIAPFKIAESIVAVLLLDLRPCCQQSLDTLQFFFARWEIL